MYEQVANECTPFVYVNLCNVYESNCMGMFAKILMTLISTHLGITLYIGSGK